MGGAQAQAITFNGGVGILVEVDPWRIERRLQLKQVDVAARDLDDAIELAEAAIGNKEAKSIALLGNAAEVHWQLIERNVVPDVVTDQTSAHDPLYGYIPSD
jgi:urocanate hydratase